MFRVNRTLNYNVLSQQQSLRSNVVSINFVTLYYSLLDYVDTLNFNIVLYLLGVLIYGVRSKESKELKFVVMRYT